MEFRRSLPLLLLLCLGACQRPGGAELRRGLSEAASGALDAATQSLTEATRLAPQSLEAALALGELALATGSSAEATRAFEAARALAPASPEAALGLARLALERGEAATALSFLPARAGASPGWRLTRARALLGRAQPTDADDALSELRGLPPAEGGGLAGYLTGAALLSLGRHAEALAAFDALRPQPAAEFGAALVAAARNEPEACAAALRRAKAAWGPRFPRAAVESHPAFSFLAGRPDFAEVLGAP